MISNNTVSIKKRGLESDIHDIHSKISFGVRINRLKRTIKGLGLLPYIIFSLGLHGKKPLPLNEKLGVFYISCYYCKYFIIRCLWDISFLTSGNLLKSFTYFLTIYSLSIKKPLIFWQGEIFSLLFLEKYLLDSSG